MDRRDDDSTDAMTETAGRADAPAVLFSVRGWSHFAWWLCAWNAAVPIRLIGMNFDSTRRPGGIGPAIGTVTLDQTSWAIATYVMFRLALRARHQPLRQVVTLLGVVAVPLIFLRRSEEHTSELQSPCNLV